MRNLSWQASFQKADARTQLGPTWELRKHNAAGEGSSLDYRRAIGCARVERIGLLPGAGGTQRLPRAIGSAAALMHILMGQPLNPRDAERKGLVPETVSGKSIDRAMEIAKRLSSHTPESLGYIKRLVRNATATPLAHGLALERNLFLKLCVSDQGLARMRSYAEEDQCTVPLD
jgi:enoyl-CoA hydratase/carnithine racemase